MRASDSTVEWRGAYETTMLGPWPGLWLSYRYTAAAQSGGRGSNITEILAALDRSTTGLGAPRVASRAASASRMTRAQRSAKGIRSKSGLPVRRYREAPACVVCVMAWQPGPPEPQGLVRFRAE